MRKEYECCVPKEIKNEFLSLKFRTRAIQQLISNISNARIDDYKIFYKEMVDELEDLYRKEFNLWGRITKMFPKLNPKNFTFKHDESALFYHEEDEEE